MDPKVINKNTNTKGLNCNPDFIIKSDEGIHIYEISKTTANYIKDAYMFRSNLYDVFGVFMNPDYAEGKYDVLIVGDHNVVSKTFEYSEGVGEVKEFVDQHFLSQYAIC